jgi:hypothetical protein
MKTLLIALLVSLSLAISTLTYALNIPCQDGADAASHAAQSNLDWPTIAEGIIRYREQFESLAGPQQHESEDYRNMVREGAKFGHDSGLSPQEAHDQFLDRCMEEYGG